MCFKINEDRKYLYERAIEGRRFHMECFNHWMNMYAIINGALFAGLYTVKTTSYTLSILVLGCLAGWFWFFSVCGFYRWIISWIRVVSHYEKKLFSSDKPEGQYLVYNIFDEKKKELYPFSTQKITQAFTFCVAIVWTVLLAYFIFKFSEFGLWEKLLAVLGNPVFWIVLIVILGVVIIVSAIQVFIAVIVSIVLVLFYLIALSINKSLLVSSILAVLPIFIVMTIAIVIATIKWGLLKLREDLSETHKSFDELEKKP